MTALLVLPDGREIYSGEVGKDAILSLTLTAGVNDTRELTLGSVCAAMLEAELLIPAGELGLSAGEEVTLYWVTGKNREKAGIFVADKPEKTGNGAYSLTAYDRVCRLDKDVTDWLESLEGWPYSLLDFGKLVCRHCGVELANTEIPNGDYQVQKFTARGITGRQLLFWVGEAACRFLRATPEGTLLLDWYTPAEKTVSASGEDFYYQDTLTYSDYRTAPIDRVQLRFDEKDVGTIYPPEAAGNTYAVTGNYLLTARDAQSLLPVAEALYGALSGVQFTPCKLTVPSRLGIREGQILRVQTPSGEELTAYVMSRTASRGRDTLECTGSYTREASAAVTSQSYKALSGKLLRLQTNVDGLTVENQDMQGRLTAITANVEGITARVEKTETTVTTVQAAAVTEAITQYYLSTSTSELSGGSWSETAPEWVDGKYMWSRTKTTKGDGSVSYSAPTCIAGATGATGPQGVPGLQGPKGDRGVQGPKGSDGKTSYTHIAYANSADGATDFTVSDSNRAYIGMYVDFSETDSTNPGDYAWSKIKGADGANGTPGKAGADGKTPYFHVAYANNATGTSGFSTTDSTNKLYIGQYTDYTQADSTDPKKYAWTKIKGDKGDTGESGVGVKSIDVQYYLSTSSTTLTGGSWSTTAPTWVNGKYMWSKTVTTLSNGGVEESKPVCITGAKGSTGTSGTTITSITEQYYLSTSKTQQTGGSWVEKPPAWSAGKYLWTRSKIVYANPTKTEYTTPVCDSSWEAVNEVQVGGTNLLLDTDAPSLTKVAAESNRVFTSMVNSGDATGAIEPLYDSPCGTKNVVRIGIVNPGAGGVAGYRFYSATKENTVGVSFIPGEQYTISCYARAVDGAPQINITLWGLTAWGWKVAPSDWTKFSLTFEATEEFNTKTTAWLMFRVKEDIAGTVEFTGFKLEKGNKATEWSPSPDEAQYAIANIQVGARNLQLGTQFWDDNCIRLPGNAEINGEEITIPSNTYTELEKIQVKNGDVYTIGCDVKSDVAYVGNSFLVQLSNEAGTRLSYEWATGSIGTDWSRIVKTITISETESPLFLGIGLRANSGVEGVDCTLTYRHMMVERGTKATDWTPAPEDTQVQIDGVVSDVAGQEVILNSQESRISSLEQSDETISAAVEKVRTDTQTSLEGVEQAVSRLEERAELAVTAEDVSIAITERLEDGVSSVTTETGYTFNQDGMRIAKSGEEMENRLDNTGMYVTRSGEGILTANNQGVTALNLQAVQYLMAGEHARFEDYEADRTGCFWI